MHRTISSIQTLESIAGLGSSLAAGVESKVGPTMVKVTLRRFGSSEIERNRGWGTSKIKHKQICECPALSRGGCQPKSKFLPVGCQLGWVGKDLLPLLMGQVLCAYLGKAQNCCEVNPNRT